MSPPDWRTALQRTLRAEWQRHPKLGGGGFGAETDVDSINLGALVRFR